MIAARRKARPPILWTSLGRELVVLKCSRRYHVLGTPLQEVTDYTAHKVDEGVLAATDGDMSHAFTSNANQHCSVTRVEDLPRACPLPGIVDLAVELLLLLQYI